MLPRSLRVVRRSLSGLTVALTLLIATALTTAAQPSVDEPDTHRDCWLGSPTQYEQCVDSNSWGAEFRFAGPDNAYRDCWLGSPFHYDACVQANNWGATFATNPNDTGFPDPNDASFVVAGIPSY